jgi:hypothetical protein
MAGAGGMTPYEERSLQIFSEINEKLDRITRKITPEITPEISTKSKAIRKPPIWVSFVSRVRNLRKAAAIKQARPNDYMTMTDEEIEAFRLGGRRNTRKRRS